MAQVKPRRFDLSPDNFIAGIAGELTAAELGVYWLICLLIYSHGGPIEDDRKRLTKLLTGTHGHTINAAIEKLQKLGKVSVNGRQMMAKGCANVIETAVKRVEKAVENGLKGGRPSNEINELEKADGFRDGKLTRVSKQPPKQPPKDSSLRSESAGVEQTALFFLPDWIPTEAWNGFVEMRAKKHSALTSRARSLTVTALCKLRDEGHDPGAVLDQSTMNGWKGVFPLKNGDGYAKRSNGHRNFLAGAALAIKEFEQEEGGDNDADIETGSPLSTDGPNRRPVQARRP